MDLMILACLMIHRHVLALDSLYSELQHLGGSCFPRDSCVPARPEGQDHLWGNHTCECGEHCVRYGTCCANSPHVGVMLHAEHRGESCQKLSAFFSQPVLAVSVCSDRWRSRCPIRDKCESPVNTAEDPMSTIPVTSTATLVSYKNYFCAMCNYDDKGVSMWGVELRFEARESVPSLSNVTKDYLLENLFYNDDSQAWGIATGDGSFHKVKFKFKIPSSIQKFVKKCYPNMVTRCGPSFTGDRKLLYKCMSYYAPVRLQGDGTRHPRKFRNVHCAMCNSANMTQPDFNMCQLDVEGRRPMFSLAHLLDINTSDGNVVGKKQVCGETEKWDPFFKKCRSLACAVPGYVVRNGKCVAS